MSRLASEARPASGLREKKKTETRERIRAAAAALFTEHGYGAATMRQIAQRAHVGLGTLFNYAEDKRDLVFLIFNDELAAITDEALAAPRADDPLVEQLLAICGCHYRRFARRAALVRVLLQELTFYSHGKQAATFVGIRRRLIEGFEALVRAAQASGRIRRDADPALVARSIFFLYSAALRWWIGAPQPDPAAGLVELRRVFELMVAGLAPLR